MKRTTYHIVAAILFFSSSILSGQEWPVPEEKAALVNPAEYNLDNVKRGKDLYIKNCKSCHGDPGKNNPLALVPLPVDIVSERMQANSEGALYYKITTGKGVMPPFGTTMSEQDRWNLVNFIMNYNPGREQILIDAPPVKAKLLASVNQENRSVEILAEFEESDGSYTGLTGVPVKVSARKAFGNMEIGQATTNDIGRAEYTLPDDFIGDEEGYISIVVSLDENYLAQEVALEKALVGKNKTVPKLIQREVLWSTNNNVSLWLLLSYIVAAGGSWVAIIYVILQIVKIKRYGKSS